VVSTRCSALAGGQLLTELVVQFMQQDPTMTDELGGIPSEEGRPLSPEPMVGSATSSPSPCSGGYGCGRSQECGGSPETAAAYLVATDLADAQLAYGDDAYYGQRARLRMRIASLHQE